MNTIINYVLNWPRFVKRLIQVLADVTLISICYFTLLLYGVPEVGVLHLLAWGFIVLLYPACLLAMNVYSAIVRYIMPSIVLRLAIASTVTVLALKVLDSLLGSNLPNRFYIDLGFIAIFCSLFPRLLFAQIVRWKARQEAVKVAIYGAGSAGRQLKSALDADCDYRVVAFLDDRTDLQNSTIQGTAILPVDKVPDLVRKGVTEVQLAIPQATRARRKEIILALEPYGLNVKTIPPLHEIVTGKAELAQLRYVTAEDLLGRDPVPPIPELIDKNVRNKNVLVSGAGGTIGSQICREIIQLNPRRLVLLESSEYALYSIEMELREELDKQGIIMDMIPVLGSVCASSLVTQCLDDYRIESIYHAAAYKHVPLVELNPLQGILNNAVGTWVIARAACEAGVSSFVLISTDKAVRPLNVMGVSKRLAELCVQALAAQASCRNCTYSIVRFGNVLGSSGSVIPRFTQQIASGGPVTVTHRNMTRFFMTVEEAAQLVMQAGAMAQSGEVFVLDMGESVNIYDLAIKKIRLHGFEPKTESMLDGDIEVRITGPRPGEKLEEELLISGALPTMHPRIYKANEPSLSYEKVDDLMREVEHAITTSDLDRLQELLKSCAEIQYRPEQAVIGEEVGVTPSSDQAVKASFQRKPENSIALVTGTND